MKHIGKQIVCVNTCGFLGVIHTYKSLMSGARCGRRIECAKELRWHLLAL